MQYYRIQKLKEHYDGDNDMFAGQTTQMNHVDYSLLVIIEKAYDAIEKQSYIIDDLKTRLAALEVFTGIFIGTPAPLPIKAVWDLRETEPVSETRDAGETLPDEHDPRFIALVEAACFDEAETVTFHAGSVDYGGAGDGQALEEIY